MSRPQPPRRGAAAASTAGRSENAAAGRVLALCADDYGLSDSIDRGILQLARAGRITEVSCLVNMPAWPADARTLSHLPRVAAGTLRAGLHFNLTEGRPLSAALARLWPQMPTLQQLIVMAHAGRLPREAVAAELKAQLDAFEGLAGRQPVHLDGHQHVHHLPGVREAVLALLAQRPSLRVRDTGQVNGPGFAIKRLLIEGTGGRRLRRELQARGRWANTELRGVYDFTSTRDFRALMQGWLRRLPDRGALVFCHPGETAEPGDPIGAARVRELAYLAGPDFEADLQAASVRLGAAV